MGSLRSFCLFIFVAFLANACSSKIPPGAAVPAVSGAPDSAVANKATAPSVEGEVAMTEEDEVENEGDEEETDIVDTEPVEGTPTDLGEVQASDKLNDEEIKADILALRTFPMVQNEFVDQWIRYFTGRGRVHFEKWLARSPRYMPLITKVMKEDGLPEDLVYLAMIESGFNPIAKSRAKAVGPWQFIKSTGQRYGLRVDSWLDERRDIEKSTHAAAQYLKELHQIFGSWYLAAASYNAGEGKVLNAVRRDKSRNFWELARQKKNFRSETRNYVPKIIAAALLSKNPEKYGFVNIAYEKPLEWENIDMPAGVTLRAVTEVSGIDKDMLRLMNAELKRGATPPGKTYALRIPLGTKLALASNLAKIQSKKYKAEAEEPVHRRRRMANARPAKPGAPVPAGSYRLQPGDTLWDLAKRNGISVAEIKKLNPVRSARSLRAGDVIKLPGTKVQ